jgi:hypothetical protein
MGVMIEKLMRLGLIVLAVPSLYTGIWAVANPHGWYESYPGLGHQWTAAFGPFSEHLATDTGAGFIAIGVAVGYAAVRLRRGTVRLALLVFLGFSIPHLIFHLSHPGDGLSGFDRAASLWSLVAGVALPVLLMLLSARMRVGRFRGYHTLGR